MKTTVFDSDGTDGGKRERGAGGSRRTGLIRDVNRDVFTVLLVLYLVLTAIEQLSYGFVSFFFDMNILLVAVMITGALLAVTKGLERSGRRPKIDMLPFPRRGVYVVAGLSVVCAVAVFSVAIEIGKVAYPLAVAFGVAVFIVIAQLGAVGAEEDVEAVCLPNEPDRRHPGTDTADN